MPVVWVVAICWAFGMILSAPIIRAVSSFVFRHWDRTLKSPPRVMSNIQDPPCHYCRMFGPYRRPDGGITLCHARDIEHDFSCFLPKGK